MQQDKFPITIHRAGNKISWLASLKEVAINLKASGHNISLYAEADIKWLTEKDKCTLYIHHGHGLTGTKSVENFGELQELLKKGDAILLSDMLHQFQEAPFGFDLELKCGVGDSVLALRALGKMCVETKNTFRILSSSYDLCVKARSECKDVQVGFLSFCAPLNMLRIRHGKILHFPKQNFLENYSFGLYPEISSMTAVDFIVGTKGIATSFKTINEKVSLSGKSFCPTIIGSRNSLAAAINADTYGAFVYMISPMKNLTDLLREVFDESRG